MIFFEIGIKFEILSKINPSFKDIVTNDTIHFFVNEKAIIAKNDLSEEFLVPSLELIKTSMEEVFNYPRYILQKIEIKLILPMVV